MCTQIAAIVLENYVRGRCRHIWFSVSHDLKMDAERYVCVCVCVMCEDARCVWNKPERLLLTLRDLRDIGCYIKVIDGCQQLDKETRCCT